MMEEAPTTRQVGNHILERQGISKDLKGVLVKREGLEKGIDACIHRIVYCKIWDSDWH